MNKIIPMVMILIMASLVMGCTGSPTPTPTPMATATPTPVPTATPSPKPAIAITSVPVKGTTGLLKGNVSNVNPADNKVAAFIFVSGWWNKPYWDKMLTNISSDGTWQCDIATNPSDTQATKVAAFLVPNGYMPPRMEGQQDFPKELLNNSTASVIINR